MRETKITKEDKEFWSMRDKIFKYVPQGTKNGKKWRAFKKYMDFYYAKLQSPK